MKAIVIDAAGDLAIDKAEDTQVGPQDVACAWAPVSSAAQTFITPDMPARCGCGGR